MTAKKGGEEKYPSCVSRDEGRVNPQAHFQSPQNNLEAHRHVLGQKDYGCELGVQIMCNKYSQLHKT